MITVREWLMRWWATFRPQRSDAELEEELRTHLELAAEDARRKGTPPDVATRLARLEAGGLGQAIDAQRDQRALPWLEDLVRDLRSTGRTLARTPGFTTVAVLSLALGIGANTAIFTLIDAVLFRTVPVEQPDRLYFLGHDPGPRSSLSSNYPLYERYRTASVFSGVTAYRSRTFRVRTADGVDRVNGQYVSGNYDAVVGAPMTLGRGFLAEDDRRPGGSPLVVISHDYWITRLAGRADVVGQSIVVDDRTVTIIGVTAPGYYGLNPGERFHIALPMSMMALDSPRFFDTYDAWVGLIIVGRLAPGVSQSQAQAAVDVQLQQFLRMPESGWASMPATERSRTAALVPAAHGTFSLRREYSKPLWVLMAMVAVLLLIACVNVAILFLARSTDRAREIAVRLAIGAGRSRLIRQLLTESVVLALLGGAAGVLVAIWGTQAMLSVFAIGPSPAAIDATVDARVLAASAAAALLTGIGFGVAPALASTALDVASSLKDGGASIQGGRRRTRGKALVVAQMALCVVLVTAAALLSTSLRNLEGFDAGFIRDRVMLADIDLTGARLSPENRLGLFSELLDRMRNHPGVESVSVSSRTPIDSTSQLRRIEVPGFEPHPRNGVSSNVVSRGYFQTFGLGIIRGRDFTEADRRGAQSVAIVSEAMARHFFGDEDPVGRTFVLSPWKETTSIVGVVEDARHERLRSDTPPRMVYMPAWQPGLGADGSLDVPTRLTISVRTSADAGTAVARIRDETRSLSQDAMVL